MMERDICLIKNHTKKMLSILVYFSVELCWHILFHDRVSIWWSLDAKNA